MNIFLGMWKQLKVCRGTEERTVISKKKEQRALPVGQVWYTEMIVTGREQKDSLRKGSLAANKVLPLCEPLHQVKASL